MDSIDAGILKRLAKNGDENASSLSGAVNLSVPAINKRIVKMKKDGTITKTTIKTDGDKIGKPISAFVQITLVDFLKPEDFLKIIESDRDILECYAVSGEYDYLIKLCAKNINDFESKLLKIKQSGGIKSYTMFCLREYKNEISILPD